MLLLQRCSARGRPRTFNFSTQRRWRSKPRSRLSPHELLHAPVAAVLGLALYLFLFNGGSGPEIDNEH